MTQRTQTEVLMTLLSRIQISPWTSMALVFFSKREISAEFLSCLKTVFSDLNMPIHLYPSKQSVSRLQRPSQNHRMVWDGRDFKDHPVPTPRLILTVMILAALIFSPS